MILDEGLEQALAESGWLAGQWHHLRHPLLSRRGAGEAQQPGAGAGIVNLVRRLFRHPQAAATHLAGHFEAFGFGAHKAAPWIEVRAFSDRFEALFRRATDATPERRTLHDPAGVVAQMDAWRASLPPEHQILMRP